MQNKKILHITYELYPKNLGGIGVFVFNLVNELSKKNPEREFFIVVPINKEEIENRFEKDNVRMIFIKECFKNNKLNYQIFSTKLQIVLKTFDNDNLIIHFHDSTLFHFMRKFKNTVYTFHKDDGILISSTKKINSCIYFTKISQKKHFIPAEKKYIIPNGMKIERKTARVAYIGRNSIEKGFNKFIYYVKNSKLNNTNIIIGIKDVIYEKITSFGILDTFQVNNEMKQLDFIIVPSVKEEFGLVILEALNAGAKIFVQNLKELKELYGTFDDVIFINFSKDNYVKKIDKYIQKKFYIPQKKMLQFSIENIANKYMKVYDEL